MSTLEMSHVVDLDQGNHHRSAVGSDVTAEEASVCFSDGDEGSLHSRFYSTNGASSDPEAGDYDGGVAGSRRASCASDFSIELGSAGNGTGVPEIKVHLDKIERDCRICHMGLESEIHEYGVPIELGCSCKDDLAAAHKLCAEAWFKIKGNRIESSELRERSERKQRTEIFVVKNVYSGNEDSTGNFHDYNNATMAATFSAAVPSVEARRFWHGHRFLNFLLACMIFAFVISWLFHFNVPS